MKTTFRITTIHLLLGIYFSVLSPVGAGSNFDCCRKHALPPRSVAIEIWEGRQAILTVGSRSVPAHGGHCRLFGPCRCERSDDANFKNLKFFPPERLGSLFLEKWGDPPFQAGASLRPAYWEPFFKPQ